MRHAMVWALLAACSCGSSESVPSASADDDDLDSTPPSALADVIGVRVTGVAGAYGFAVTIASPDSGCTQYADWWEVLTEEGELVYRRILLHSHVTEQPFTRSSTSPVEIEAEQTVWVRAHMHPGGYGGQARRGSVSAGFDPGSPDSGFADDLATQPPLPDGCNF